MTMKGLRNHIAGTVLQGSGFGAVWFNILISELCNSDYSGPGRESGYVSKPYSTLIKAEMMCLSNLWVMLN